MNSPDTVSFSEMTLLRMLSSRNHRPNLMIVNERGSLASVLEELSTVCDSPLRVCEFPGILILPTDTRGTLVLGDVDRLTIAQQITLSDWISRKAKDLQIVSVTRAPMTELIAEGRFLEGLFFRLNTVVIHATTGGEYRPAW